MAQSVARISDNEISRLAREIARDIRPLDEILKSFGLDAAQFDKVSDAKFFQVRLQEEIQLWNASDPLSIAKRIETKAATMIEDCLLEVFAMIHDREQPMQAKVAALQWAARMAGMGEARQADTSGGVKITINVGSKSLEFDKAPQLHPRVIDGTVVDLTPDKAN